MRIETRHYASNAERRKAIHNLKKQTPKSRIVKKGGSFSDRWITVTC